MPPMRPIATLCPDDPLLVGRHSVVPVPELDQEAGRPAAAGPALPLDRLRDPGPHPEGDPGDPTLARSTRLAMSASPSTRPSPNWLPTPSTRRTRPEWCARSARCCKSGGAVELLEWRVYQERGSAL